MDTVTLPKELPPESEINGMTELFKVLGDPTRELHPKSWIRNPAKEGEKTRNQLNSG